MAFPSSPTNNQTATVNGILYTYNSTKGVWSVTTNTGTDISANSITTVGKANVASVYTTTGVYWTGNGASYGSGSAFVSNVSLTTGYPAVNFSSTVSSRSSTIGIKDGYNMFVDAAAGGYLLLTQSGANTGVGGNVSPAHQLSVAGTTYTSGVATFAANAVIGGNILMPSAALASSYIQLSPTNLKQGWDGSGTQVSGTGYVFLNQSGPTYSTQVINARGGVATDQATYLTVSGGTTGATYFSGNVGVGTTTPSTSLQVVNNDNAYKSQIKLSNTNSGTQAATAISFNDWATVGVNASGGTPTNFYLYNGLNTFTSFSNNGAEKMRLSAAGGLGIGTTADPGAGAIYATAAITAYYSDQRLKTVIGTISNALDKVDSLSGVLYVQNSVAAQYGYTDTSQQVGVLAQQVLAVQPEAVKPAPFDLDENGNSKSGQNYLTVQYEKLVPLLIEAIKELRVEVNELKRSIK